MTVLVSGGRSPIALAVVRSLDKEGIGTLLVTRSPGTDLSQDLQGTSHCNVVTWDLLKTQACVDEVAARDDITAFVAMHRYRGLEDPLSQHVVDVVTTYEIVRSLATKSSLDDPIPVVLAVSPAARAVVGNQDFWYHSSRSSLAALTRWAAVNFAETGLRVNAVSPGAYIRKPRSEAYFQDHPEKLDWARWVTPAQRQGGCDEVASTVRFLLSDQASYINGQIIEIDGGASLRDSPGLDPDLGYRGRGRTGHS